MTWLDGLLDGLSLTSAAVCGHSYGTWIGLNYALHAPDRVSRLVLIDPMSCLAGLSLTYRLRAVPVFARPSEQHMRRFLQWETDGADVQPDWLTLTSLGGEYRGGKVVMPHPTPADRLHTMSAPTLLLLAERSRAHNVNRVARGAEPIPHLTTRLIPDATHHTVPQLHAQFVNDEITAFLT